MSNTAVNVFGNQKLEPYYEGVPHPEMSVKLPVSVVYPRGTVLGELTATPGTFSAYASGNADGSQYPKAILSFDVTTDASGNAMIAGLAPFGLMAATPTAPAYFAGAFRCEDLKPTGPGALDAGAVAGPYMKIINGTITAGVVELL